MKTRLFLITAVVFALSAAPALASTAVATFDDQQPDAFISDQYASPNPVGVTFNGGDAYGLPDGFQPHVDAAPAQAHSGANVADLNTCAGGCGEFSYSPHARGYLSPFGTGVSVWVGYLGSGAGTALVSLTAYNSNGDPVAASDTATVSQGATFKQLSVSSAQADIAYFDVGAYGQADANKLIAIDDLAITHAATPPPPDFFLSAAQPQYTDTAGEPLQIPIHVHRANGSTGNIAFAAAGLPAGMSASFSPAPVTGTGNLTTLTLSIDKDSPASQGTVTVTGTPDAGAGQTPRTVKFTLTVAVNCDHTVTMSYFDARTDGCFQHTAKGEEAFNTPVRVNGLLLTPLTSTGAGSELIVDESAGTVKSVGDYAVSLPDQPDIRMYTGAINWKLGGPVGDPKTVIDQDNGLGQLKFKGLPVGHTKIQLSRNYHAQVQETVKLGFWPFDYFGALTGTPVFDTSNFGGTNFNGMEIKLDKVEVPGLGLKDVDFRYVSGEEWSGKATVVLPFASPLEVSAGIGLKNGDLDFISGGVNGLQVPIGEGIFLQKIAFEVHTGPPSFAGTIGLSAGPAIEGKAAVTFDGTLAVTLGDPWVVEVDGSAKIADKFELGKAFAKFTSNGLFEVGGKAKWNLDVGSIEGSVDGWLQGSTFDIEGSVKGCINLWIGDACAGANALVSSIGIAACVDLTVVSGGIGYTWGGSFDLFGGSCDLSPWRPVMTAADAASGARRFLLPAGLPEAAFALDGVGGSPGVTVTGPNGESASVSMLKPFARRGNVLAVMARRDTTYVVIKRPAAGVWTLTPTGTVPIKRIRESMGLPEPAVAARVTGSGRARTLHWNLKPIPGQEVRFAEIGRDVRHLIAKTTAASGSVAFRPADGPAGRRQIVALVMERGLPRRRLVVGSYLAPGPETPARASRVKIARHGTRLTVSWRAPRQTFRFAVYVTIGDGRKLLLIAPAGARSITVKGVAPRYGATAVIAGLTPGNGRGPSARATIRGRHR